MGVLYEVASLLYRAAMLAGGFWCHQRAERSPHLFGVQFPLCWRCTGIAVGVLFITAWLMMKKRLPTLALSLAFALALPLDVFTAMAGLWAGANPVRFVTGLLWGAASACLALHFLRWWQLRRGRRETAGDFC